MKQERMDGVQALRALAAFMVVYSHAVSTYVVKTGATGIDVERNFAYGSAGVSIFFVISGFIMMSSGANRFGVTGASSDFIIRRIIRIVPLYWIATIIYGAKLVAEGQAPKIDVFLQSLFFIPHLNQAGEIHPLLGLGWTLNAEMFFYLVFGMALMYSKRAGLLIIISVILVSGGLGSILWLHYEENTAQSGLSPVLIAWSDPLVLLFLVGVGLALMRPVLVKRYGLLPDQMYVLLAISVVLVVTNIVLMYGNYWYELARSVVCITVVAFMVLVRNAVSASPFRKLLCLLGDASFSIYLMHSFVLGPLGRIWHRFLPTISVEWFVITGIVGSAVVGVLCYWFVEKPILRATLHLFAHAKSTSVPVTALKDLGEHRENVKVG